MLGVSTPSATSWSGDDKTYVPQLPWVSFRIFLLTVPSTHPISPLSPLFLPPSPCPDTPCVRFLANTQGEALVTVCPGHPKNNLRLPCLGVGIQSPSLLLSCSFLLCFMPLDNVL